LDLVRLLYGGVAAPAARAEQDALLRGYYQVLSRALKTAPGAPQPPFSLAQLRKENNVCGNEDGRNKGRKQRREIGKREERKEEKSEERMESRKQSRKGRENEEGEERGKKGRMEERRDQKREGWKERNKVEDFAVYGLLTADLSLRLQLNAATVRVPAEEGEDGEGGDGDGGAAAAAAVAEEFITSNAPGDAFARAFGDLVLELADRGLLK
ncbi:Protein of unknown function, partial [Gryllus bimaculatus]